MSNKKLLWAPWRIEYITSEKEKGCIFCNKPKENRDEENLILFRGKKGFVIMNRFPYNSGHLMVVPYTHKMNFEDLDEEELLELGKLIQISIKVLKEAMNPDAFNVGLNLGKTAGAGIEEHLHYHIVPRWNGDTNFMPVISDTRIVPESLENTYKKLKKIFKKYE